MTSALDPAAMHFAATTADKLGYHVDLHVAGITNRLTRGGIPPRLTPDITHISVNFQVPPEGLRRGSIQGSPRIHTRHFDRRIAQYLTHWKLSDESGGLNIQTPDPLILMKWLMRGEDCHLELHHPAGPQRRPPPHDENAKEGMIAKSSP